MVDTNQKEKCFVLPTDPGRPCFCQKKKKKKKIVYGFSDWLFVIHFFFIVVER